MSKRILISLSVIGAVAAIAVGGTIAYFSDTETSTGNTFTAGAIDLQIDSHATFNGAVVSGSTWTLKDLSPTSDKFFNFADIKPGDVGENTISLHVINNDAWVCAEVSNLTDRENGQSEPEALVDITTGEFQGELSQNMVWKVWRDDGTGGGVAGDNIQNGTEQTLASGHPVNGVLPVYDSTTGTGALVGGSTAYLGVSWNLPAATENGVQTDIMTGDISFNVVQSRNNANFRCVQPEIITEQSALMQFGPTGWAGWSCPVSHPNIVGGSTNCSLTLTNSLAWQSGASVGSYNYPMTPFGYNYTSPTEEGWIVQNGATGQNCNILLDCQAD